MGVDPWQTPFSARPPAVCPPELVSLGTCEACPLTLGDPAPGYWFVAGKQCYTTAGVAAQLSQHQPDIGIRGVKSIAQISAIKTYSNLVDAIEVGWVVWPSCNQLDKQCPIKDNLPHLFIFRTIGDQSAGGCYVWKNGDCGWVATQNVHHQPGDVVTVTTTTSPQEYGIFYSSSDGNWWVNYQLNYSHFKWEFVWEPLEAVRVISYLSNRSSKRLSSFS